MKYFLLVPALIFFLIFTIWPIGEVIYLSTLETNFMKTTFVGIDNYIKAFNDADFIQSIFNSFEYAIILVIGQIVCALSGSLFIYNMSKKWQDASRIIFYIPILSAGIIIASSWRWLFSYDGLVNWIIGQKINWFGQGETAIPIICFIVIFSSVGANMIILLASILTIDKSLFESARIDGAKEWQMELYIIIPLIKPTLVLIGFLSFINAFQIFENIYALAPQTYAATMTYFIYQQGFEFGKYGMASAESVILLGMMIMMTLIKKKVIG